MTLFANLTFHNTWSQKNSEIGLPLIQNYSSKDYAAATDNWGIVQDSLGILYFANGYGVLSYDGSNWDLLELPNLGSVLSLAIDKKGKIYVGAANELGYLKSDSIGQLSYISMMSELPQEHQDVNNIRKIHITDDGIIFGSETSVYRWKENKFKVWKIESRSKTFFEKGNLYVKIEDKGLMKLKNDQLELVNDGNFFKNMKMTTLTSFDNDRLLVSSKDRLFLYDGKNFEPFSVQVIDFFNENIIYTITHLYDGTIAIGTLHKGILFIDREGKKQIELSQKGLLHSKEVTSLFKDRSGMLWATFLSGIAKIEYPSPFTFYNNYNNTPDAVVGFQRYKDKLYVASTEGLFFVDTQNSEQKTILNRIKKNLGTLVYMLPFDDKLLVASQEGVFEIDENENVKNIYEGRIQTLYRSKVDANRIYIGLYPGLTSIYNKSGQWVEESKIEGISFRPVKLLEDKNGTLWLTTDKNEIGRLSFNSSDDTKNAKNPILKIFSSKDGVPNSRGYVYVIENEVYFKAADGAYRFDPEKEYFNLDKELYKKIGLADRNLKINYVDKNDNLWLIDYDKDGYRLDQLIVQKDNNDSYDIKKLNERRIIDKRAFRPVYPEFKDSVIWYKGKPGIIRHDLRKTATTGSLNYKAHISKVLWQNDSLLFGGYMSASTHQLPFKNNQLRFQYASPSFYEESENLFQVFLEGFDEEWSKWTSETKKDYTNIPEGNYSFKVRSKNIFNTISAEDTYSFSISPPWHRTLWAYLLYGMGAIGIVTLYSKWRSKELKRKNIVLENTINNRTLEIRQKNELLNHQTEQLVQINESKTKLYSNITHEFRTPLTVILGMADTLKTNVKDNSFEGANTSLEMIRRNGKNLLQLVNEMLDLARVESGSMELNLVQTDAIPFVKYLGESFHSLAEAKKINLTVYSEIEALEMDIDLKKMGSIISNLLSNAIKFTQENGKVIVHINKMTGERDNFFVLKVQDNGLGLADEEIAHLFDRFYRVNNPEVEQEGAGIGLSLVKEFVELMNGTITVKSKPKKGSTFIVQIPITNTANKTVNPKVNIEPTVKVPLPVSKKEALVVSNDTSERPFVLIIEDNMDVAHYLKTCLQSRYQTMHAVNGDEGLQMAFGYIPDIIISDVMMPGKDGLEICDILKADERTDHIPIILLTAKVTPEDRLAGLKHGADAYLSKPFIQEELFARLDQLILVRKKLISKLQENGFSTLLKEPSANPQAKFLQQLLKIIDENLDNSNFNAAHLAKEMGLSESQIYRKLKATTGKSTAIFIRSVRLQKAKELIQNTDKNISEIAYEVGFNDPSWFSRAFKEEFGHAPSEINN